jgi:hypothetical protein
MPVNPEGAKIPVIFVKIAVEKYKTAGPAAV